MQPFSNKKLKLCQKLTLHLSSFSKGNVCFNGGPKVCINVKWTLANVTGLLASLIPLDIISYNYPFLISFDPEERIESCPTPPVRGAASSATEVSYSHPTTTITQGDLSLRDGTEHVR